MNTDHTHSAAEPTIRSDEPGRQTFGKRRPVAEDGSARASGAAELLVPPAMLVVAIAIGLACHLHFGFPAEIGAALGLAVFCIMLLCHVLLRSSEQQDYGASDRAGEVTSPIAAAPRPPRRSKRPAAPAEKPVRHGGKPQPPPTPMESGPVDATASATQTREPMVLTVGPASVIAPANEAAKAQQWTYRPLELELPDRIDDAASDATAHAFGSMRPSIDDDEPSHSLSANPTENGVTTPASSVFGSPMLSEQERIEQILKRLAAQIRSGGALPSTAAGTGEGITPADQQLHTGVDQAPPDTALESAVNTLRSTVEAMRSAAPALPERSPTSPPLGPKSAEPAAQLRPATAAEVRLAAVAEALAAERANVFLQPILALADDSARHFEVSVRLRLRDGQALDRQQVSHQIRGAGLLPLLDAIGVRHSAGFALKLERRGREGAVFSQIAGESLERADFVNDIAGRQAQGIADRLVLSFDQEEIRALGVAQMSALAALNELGFRFAIEGVSHLDMDFEALAATGFAFVKLEAEVFASGLALGGTVVPPSDLANFFGEHGLAVIVGRIQDEAVRNRMLQYGVGFGQGALFGEPRPVPIGTLDVHDGVAA